MDRRPLDVLEASLDSDVTAHLKDGTAFHGVMTGFDQHMNLVLEPADSEAHDRSQPEPGKGDADRVAVEDTTVIRGDNLVSINP